MRLRLSFTVDIDRHRHDLEPDAQDREVGEHPHGLIPTGLGAVIRLGNGSVAVLSGDADSKLWGYVNGRVRECRWQSPTTIQALADEYGFEVLVPESAVTDETGDDDEE